MPVRLSTRSQILCSRRWSRTRNRTRNAVNCWPASPADHEKVKLIDGKLTDVVNYGREAIRNANSPSKVKRGRWTPLWKQRIMNSITCLPRKKNMIILERNFQLNQKKVYQFLLEKRTEASSRSGNNFISQDYTIRVSSRHRSTSGILIDPRRGPGYLWCALRVSATLRAWKSGRQRDGGKMTTSPVAGVIRELSVEEIIGSDFPFADLALRILFCMDWSEEKNYLMTSSVQGEKIICREKFSSCSRTQRFGKVILTDMNLHHSTSSCRREKSRLFREWVITSPRRCALDKLCSSFLCIHFISYRCRTK